MSGASGSMFTEIKRHLPSLSDRQEAVARFVLSEPDRVKSIALQELSRTCKASEPVIFAFCKKLGFKGFSDFKTALAEELGARRSSSHGETEPGLEVADEDLLDAANPGELLRRLISFYQSSLQHTMQSVDARRMSRAVKLVSNAKRIVLFGVGVSGNVGYVLQHNFIRTGIPTTWVNDCNLFYTHLAPLKKGDVCIALSQTGSQKDTADAVAFAKKRGITVILITSDPRSVMADDASVVLLTGPGPESATMHLSIGAQLALPVLVVGDALAIAVALENEDQLMERSGAIGEAMEPRVAKRRR